MPSDAAATPPREPETRGGYTSSGKPVSQLKPPPTGPAPGAASTPRTEPEKPR